MSENQSFGAMSVFHLLRILATRSAAPSHLGVDPMDNRRSMLAFPKGSS